MVKSQKTNLDGGFGEGIGQNGSLCGPFKELVKRNVESTSSISAEKWENKVYE